MSYCVNCGVELDKNLKACPLCQTRVVNPNELIIHENEAFPKSKGEVEKVKRRDVGVVVSIFLIATAVTCGFLNLFVFDGIAWSPTVMGVCGFIWATLFPIILYGKLPVYLYILFDGFMAGVSILTINIMTISDTWAWGLGIPIVALITVVAELLAFAIKVLPRSFLTVTLYIFTAIAVLCVGLEWEIDYFLTQTFRPSWSAVVATVFIIFDAVIITLLSSRRLRAEVRRRLHF